MIEKLSLYQLKGLFAMHHIDLRLDEKGLSGVSHAGGNIVIRSRSISNIPYRIAIRRARILRATRFR